MNSTTAAQAGDLLYQRCWDKFMVLASLFDLRDSLARQPREFARMSRSSYSGQYAPVVAREVAQRACVELHPDDGGLYK